MIRAIIRAAVTAAVVFAFVWALYGPLSARAGASGCVEGDACWSCETQGNHICGDDRWVTIVQNHGGALSISRQTPQVAARRFYNAPGVVCITVARRADGTVDRFRLCHA